MLIRGLIGGGKDLKHLTAGSQGKFWPAPPHNSHDLVFAEILYVIP